MKASVQKAEVKRASSDLSSGLCRHSSPVAQTSCTCVCWHTHTHQHTLLVCNLGYSLYIRARHIVVQFSSVAQSCPTLCDPMNRSMPGLPVHHQLPEVTQTHVHQVSDAIQPSHSLSSPSPPAPNPSQHQSLFQWVNSPHEVAKVLEFQPQHQSFQWTPRTGLL